MFVHVCCMSVFLHRWFVIIRWYKANIEQILLKFRRWFPVFHSSIQNKWSWAYLNLASVLFSFLPSLSYICNCSPFLYSICWIKHVSWFYLFPIELIRHIFFYYSSNTFLRDTNKYLWLGTFYFKLVHFPFCRYTKEPRKITLSPNSQFYAIINMHCNYTYY